MVIHVQLPKADELQLKHKKKLQLEVHPSDPASGGFIDTISARWTQLDQRNTQLSKRTSASSSTQTSLARGPCLWGDCDVARVGSTGRRSSARPVV